MIRKMDAYRVYMLYILLTDVGFALVWTLNMVYQVEIVGLDAFQLVLVGTALETTAFLFEVPTGVVADVYSRRLSLIIGVALLGVGFALLGMVPIFGVILFSQCIAGIGYTFISGAGSAWLADEIGEAPAGRAYLRASQIGMIGGVAGIILCVGLGSIHLQIPIVLGGLLFLVTAGLLALVMPEDGFTPTPKEERETWGAMRSTLREGGATIRRRPVLVTILGIMFVFGAFSEGFDRLWTLHLLENFSLPAIGSLNPVVWFGIIGIVSMIFGAAFTEVVRRRVNIEKHDSIARALLIIHGLLIASVVLFAVSDNLILSLAAFWLVGSLRGVNGPLQMAWVNQGLDSKVRATVLSITAQTDAIGQIAGGPGIGYVGRVFGVRTALALGGLILSPGLALYLRTLRQGPVVVLAEAAAAD